MKRLLKPLLIMIKVLILLLFLYIVCSFIIYNKFFPDKTDKDYTPFSRYNFHIKKYIYKYNFRPSNGLGYKKKGIIVFGDSFVKGDMLNDNQTFTYKLSEQTKRPVYNMGIGGSFAQHVLFQVQSGYLHEKIKESEYVIFMVASLVDLRRLKAFSGNYTDKYFLFDRHLYPTYDLVNEDKLHLHIAKFPIIEGSLIYRIVAKYVKTHKYDNEKYIRSYNKAINNDLKLFYAHIKNINYELKKINPDIKFVIYLYWDETNTFRQYTEKMRDDGIIIISNKDFTSEDLSKEIYIQKDYFKPTEEAWNLIVPNMVKELKL